MKSLLLLLSGFLLAISIAARPAHAVSKTDSYGGPGGSAYELACPGRSVMMGLQARSGAWIDALAPICAVWVQNSKTLGEIEPQRSTGGTGGGPAFIRCAPPRGVIVGVELFQANNRDGSIGHIVVNCGDLQKPSEFANKLGGSADYLGDSQRGGRVTLHCGPGQVAKGLYGKSGVFVDRIGLLCEPTPLPAQAATAPLRGPRCKTGFVWRGARQNDYVCVSPDSRDRVARENASAASGYQPGAGTTCRPGLVWREAFAGDTVCVTTAVRAQVADENANQIAREAQ